MNLEVISYTYAWFPFFYLNYNFIFNYFRVKQIQHLSIKEPNNNPIIYCTSKILAKIVSSPQRQSAPPIHFNSSSYHLLDSLTLNSVHYFNPRSSDRFELSYYRTNNFTLCGQETITLINSYESLSSRILSLPLAFRSQVYTLHHLPFPLLFLFFFPRERNKGRIDRPPPLPHEFIPFISTKFIDSTRRFSLVIPRSSLVSGEKKWTLFLFDIWDSPRGYDRRGGGSRRRERRRGRDEYRGQRDNCRPTGWTLSLPPPIILWPTYRWDNNMRGPLVEKIREEEEEEVDGGGW